MAHIKPLRSQDYLDNQDPLGDMELPTDPTQRLRLLQDALMAYAHAHRKQHAGLRARQVALQQQYSIQMTQAEADTSAGMAAVYAESVLLQRIGAALYREREERVAAMDLAQQITREQEE
jgi:hypothetical protein